DPQGVGCVRQRVSVNWRRWLLEEGGLIRAHGGAAPVLRAGLGLRLLRRLPRDCRQLPPFLVGDAVALLDHEQIDETRKGIPQQPEVLLPVARRVRERAHAVERERERGAVALPSREAE